jgi:predicted TIM-barrel fold metal-dependent hydrolase
MKLQITLLLLLVAHYATSQQDKEPIIDMHLHALPHDENGPQQVSLCYPVSTMIPYMDASQNGIDVFMKAMSNPPCDNPMLSAESDEALFQEILKRLKKYNIQAVTSGKNNMTIDWYQRAPERILPSIGFNLDYLNMATDSIKILIQKHGFIGIGEIANQYGGIGVDDPRMDAYYALAEKLDIPIGLHMGSGAPGSPMTISPDYEAHLSNPLHLEKVIKKYPKLRLYIMHYGEPFIDELITLLYHYPHVYVDLGGIQWTYPADYFYEYHLKKLVSAGFGKRIMFGSDAMVFPDLIDKSIELIEEADFLTYEQKRDIFYNNAARFLRLEPTR